MLKGVFSGHVARINNSRWNANFCMMDTVRKEKNEGISIHIGMKISRG